MNKNEILILYGDSPKQMAKKLLESAKLETLIPAKNAKIGIKPNLVVSNPAETGATTHPELAAGVIEYLQERGFSDITILEGSWVGDRTSVAFETCGYNRLAKQYSVKLIDTQKDTFAEYDCKGMKIAICDSAMQMDFLVNMPVLKGHCQTGVTCALKNAKGIIPDREKSRFHAIGLHKPIAHLNTRVKNGFILVDSLCGDLNFEEGGNPVRMNRIFAALDPVLCDSFACALMGYDIDEVPYIPLAAKLGAGNCVLEDARITELNEPAAAGQLASEKRQVSRRVKDLSRVVKEDGACSACYAALIYALERMSERGTYNALEPPVCIGQLFREKSGKIGIGNCTKKFERFAPGCPPRADDIVRFLESL